MAKALRSDPALTELLNSAIRYSPTVFDVTIADSEGRGLLSTDPTNLDHLVPQRPEYAELESGGLLRLLKVVFGPPRVYNLTLPWNAIRTVRHRPGGRSHDFPAFRGRALAVSPHWPIPG